MAIEGGGAAAEGQTKKRERQIALSLSVGGGYLLSHFRSTIGVVRLNFSVRNGKRWDPHAITTLVRLQCAARLSGPLSRRTCDKVERNHRKRLPEHFGVKAVHL